MLEEDCS